MLGVGILAAGAVLLWASLTGRVQTVLAALQTDLQHFDPSAGDVGAIQVGSNNRPVGHFVVNLPGGGSVTTNASDPQAAIQNVFEQTGMVGTVT